MVRLIRTHLTVGIAQSTNFFHLIHRALTCAYKGRGDRNALHALWEKVGDPVENEERFKKRQFAFAQGQSIRRPYRASESSV